MVKIVVFLFAVLISHQCALLFDRTSFFEIVNAQDDENSTNDAPMNNINHQDDPKNKTGNSNVVLYVLCGIVLCVLLIALIAGLVIVYRKNKKTNKFVVESVHQDEDFMPDKSLSEKVAPRTPSSKMFQDVDTSPQVPPVKEAKKTTPPSSGNSSFQIKSTPASCKNPSGK